jgi:hypothetical protein
MKDINEMTLDELKDLESLINIRKSYLAVTANIQIDHDLKAEECFLYRDDYELCLYKILVVRPDNSEVEQIHIELDNYSAQDCISITGEFVSHAYLGNLTKINKEIYAKVYNLVSKYEDELEKFKDNYLDKIKELLDD